MSIQQLLTEINNYLVNCTANNGYCAVPVYSTSITVGNLIFKNIEINYSVDSNPIYLDMDLISAFLNASSGFADIPITIESDRASTIGVSDIRYDYAGGNATIEVFTFNATSGVDKTVNDTLDLIIYYSDWDYNFPTYIDYLEFIPNSPTSKNVTPYGQTTNTPIFNFTMYNYGEKDMNFSIKIDETSSNINITYNATGSTKPSSGNILNTTWMDVGNNLEYLNNTQVWLWADYGYASPQVNWTWWFPNIYFRGCCEDCVCSEDLT